MTGTNRGTRLCTSEPLVYDLMYPLEQVVYDFMPPLKVLVYDLMYPLEPLVCDLRLNAPLRTSRV